jgi:hypothetical protein
MWLPVWFLGNHFEDDLRLLPAVRQGRKAFLEEAQAPFIICEAGITAFVEFRWWVRTIVTAGAVPFS